jgi:3-methyladenine DNA glycosylase AlkC
MTRAENIASIEALLDDLTAEQLQVLVQIIDAWVQLPENAATRHAIAQGIAEAQCNQFASEAEVAAAFSRFRQ